MSWVPSSHEKRLRSHPVNFYLLEAVERLGVWRGASSWYLGQLFYLNGKAGCEV